MYKAAYFIRGNFVTFSPNVPVIYSGWMNKKKVKGDVEKVPDTR